MAIGEAMAAVELEARALVLRLTGIALPEAEPLEERALVLRLIVVTGVALFVAWVRVLPQLRQRSAWQLRVEQEAAAEAAATELLGGRPHPGPRAKQPRPERRRLRTSKWLAAAKKGLEGRERLEDAAPATRPRPLAHSIEVPSVPTVARPHSREIREEHEDTATGRAVDALVQEPFVPHVAPPPLEVFEDFGARGRGAAEPGAVSEEPLSGDDGQNSVHEDAEHVNDSEPERAGGSSESDAEGSRRPPSLAGSSCASTPSLLDDAPSSSDEDEARPWRSAEGLAPAALLALRPATLRHTRPECLGGLRLREVDPAEEAQRPHAEARRELRPPTGPEPSPSSPPRELDVPLPAFAGPPGLEPRMRAGTRGSEVG